MATNEVVTTLRSDLRSFTERLDRELAGLQLVMIFQKKMALGSGKWTLCVCADALDNMTEREAITLMLEKLEQSTKAVASAIDRVLVLHSKESALAELLLDVETTQDASLLIGRSVFDRKIARAHLFLVRHASQSPSLEQSLIA